MHHPARHPALRRFTALAVALAFLPGCANEKPKPNSNLIIRYKELGPKADVPAFMKGTLWEFTDRTNDEPYALATYGLVGRLRGTGDSTVSLPVRQWMTKEMIRHGWGSKLLPGYEKIGPEQVLRDPNYAIVRVDGQIPPGAREGDFFDISVSVLPGNKTSSLSGGILFESNLNKLRGSTPEFDAVDSLAKGWGPIVVNPAYALADAGSASGQAKASLRSGMIMDGGRMMNDRPLLLRLRHPARPMARAIETRINQRFQQEADRARKDVMPVTYQVAAAIDEGLVEVYVPKAYKGDWEHFMGVVEHLYLSGSPGTLIAKAKELTAEAQKPEAPLMDISYALEGIGEPALQYVLPLMVHQSPDVAFAMARAAVFIGDGSGAAQDTLLRMARGDSHPFQLAAIQTLGSLRASPERNQKMRDLLESKNTLARVEAYKVLVRNGDALYSKVIKEKFALDVVPAGGEPVIYASRSGIPRVALIGPKPQLNLPIVFTTMNGKLMISSPNVGKHVTIFFRDEGKREPVKMLSRPDLAEVIARLGGEGAPEEEKFDFTYGEVLAIVQELSKQHKVCAARADGQLTLASFVFEQPQGTQDMNESAPAIEETRPNTSDDAARATDPASLPRTGASVAAARK